MLFCWNCCSTKDKFPACFNILCCFKRSKYVMVSSMFFFSTLLFDWYFLYPSEVKATGDAITWFCSGYGDFKTLAYGPIILGFGLIFTSQTASLIMSLNPPWFTSHFSMILSRRVNYKALSDPTFSQSYWDIYELSAFVTSSSFSCNAF